MGEKQTAVVNATRCQWMCPQPPLPHQRSQERCRLRPPMLQASWQGKYVNNGQSGTVAAISH
ncbi:hypothetical protein [Neosynechococcus sphagnicola]|uniref:hypothetical protein n=1 Tax=Neosynechococcus sphagnicola TaxID=1501145 RepID=UPI0012E09D0E|nr:hypothetical protein [Neosynechococcus sphagnicola]